MNDHLLRLIVGYILGLLTLVFICEVLLPVYDWLKRRIKKK